MLNINLILDIESTYSGKMTLLMNYGGITGVKIDDRYLKTVRDFTCKSDKVYISQNLAGIPKSK